MSRSSVLGRALFDRFVVEVDFDRWLLTLHEPESYAYRGDGEVLPIRLVAGHPHCDGVVVLPGGDRRTLELAIDTGAGSALTLIRNARPGLSAPPDATTRRLGRGMNGEIHGEILRLPRLELGSLSLTGVVAGVAPRRSGIAPNADANLGADVLSRFRVIFDYSRRRMILEPGAAFAEPFEADMSGVVLLAEGEELDRLVVEQVRKGSPGAAAGLMPGDQLIAVDGLRPTLAETVRMFRRGDGVSLPLTVERAGRRLSLRLVLKREV